MVIVKIPFGVLPGAEDLPSPPMPSKERIPVVSKGEGFGLADEMLPSSEAALLRESGGVPYAYKETKWHGRSAAVFDELAVRHVIWMSMNEVAKSYGLIWRLVRFIKVVGVSSVVPGKRKILRHQRVSISSTRLTSRGWWQSH